MLSEYEIKIKDLSPDMQDIVEIIGLENALKLAESLGPGPIYLPTKKSIFREAKNRAIRAEFNGVNYKELAHKYSFSVTWIRNIIHK